MRSEAAKPNRAVRRSIHFAITLQMDRDLEELLETGLYGFSRTDVARRLLARALLLELPGLRAIKAARKGRR